MSTAASVSWKLDLENVTHRWIVYGQYEGGAFINWARAFLPREGIVVDSGANIGQMLIYFAQFVPEGRVIAFEPCAESADWLEECLQAHPEFPVELMRVALGEQDKAGFIESFGPASIHGAWNQVSETKGEPIAIKRLDEMMQTRGIRSIDLWKLDVEGYEMSALRGAESLLRSRSLRAIYVELAYSHGQQIIDYLEGFGYRCFVFDKSGDLRPPPRPLPSHTNGLFLPAR